VSCPGIDPNVRLETGVSDLPGLVEQAVREALNEPQWCGFAELFMPSMEKHALGTTAQAQSFSASLKPASPGRMGLLVRSRPARKSTPDGRFGDVNGGPRVEAPIPAAKSADGSEDRSDRGAVRSATALGGCSAA
jgi:hypothetical protein